MCVCFPGKPFPVKHGRTSCICSPVELNFLRAPSSRAALQVTRSLLPHPRVSSAIKLQRGSGFGQLPRARRKERSGPKGFVSAVCCVCLVCCE